MRKTVPLAFALLALALPAGAAAQIVPPGNSAASQYTETFPSSKGEENAQGPKQQKNPDKVIGTQKTKQLEEQGPEGAAVAEFTAETAPTTSAGGQESSGGGKADNGGGNSNGGGKADGKGNGDGNGNGANGQNAGGEENSEAGGGAATGGGSSSGPSGSSGSSGSSAVGEVASQATGVSSGALGLWLPIALVAVVAWAAFAVWRRREASERTV